MKLIIYEPSACREEEPIFNGTVTIHVPSYPQRLEYIKACQFDVKQVADGQVEANVTASNISALIKMIELAKSHIKKIELTKEGTKYASFDELLDDPDCDEICNELATAVINGVKIPKKLNQQSDSKLTGSTKVSSQPTQATI